VTSKSTQIPVHRATVGDADTIAHVLTKSFLDGPVADWLIPDQTTRREVYRRCFGLVAQHALRNGNVLVTDDGAGVALWYPMLKPAPEDPEFEAQLAVAAGEHIGRYALKLSATAEHHPTAPHYHLAYLGVRPDRQGAGLGSALLQAYHASLARAGTPGYLEATNERNRRLYLRQGYTSAEPVHLPDGGPPMWPMWWAGPHR
jgi:GNAT superfamily N-acetyltransferase